MLVFKSFFFFFMKKTKQKKNNLSQISPKCWEFLSCWAHCYSLGEHWASNVALHLIIGGKFITRLFFFIRNPGIKDGKDTGVSDYLISF